MADTAQAMERGTGRRIRPDMLTFPAAVYADRLKTVQADMRARGLAGVLLFDPENMYWLTGYQTIGYFTFQTMFVPQDGKPVIVARAVNRDLALAHSTIAAFEAVSDTADPIQIVTRVLNGLLDNGATLGMETGSWYLTVRDYRRLEGGLSCRLVDFNGVIEPHRIVKSADELDRVRWACRAAEAGLDAAIQAIAPGKTENDIAAAMYAASIAAGSEYLGHPPLVVAGAATSLCFAMWRRREIRRGDVVLLEAAGCIDRYHGILSRPVVVGEPSERHRMAADALQGVLEAAIDAVRPGLTAGEVDRVCRKNVEERGYGAYFRHRAAYGIGIGFPPNWSEGHIYAIRPDDPLVLEPDMTFHIIPTLFFEDFGMCFSDSVRVTETGAEVLTDYPRKLFAVEA
ncbi:MAG: Xaa-Pro peptidase family protein [Alphaproteobacteria bacterium]|nr:Xaa-Pro peptidase family protein [Alphaproteobacteria bacterium]